jgi:hypothetical protein
MFPHEVPINHTQCPTVPASINTMDALAIHMKATCVFNGKNTTSLLTKF